MRDHTPDFKLQPLSHTNRTAVERTVRQLVEHLVGDGRLEAGTLLEFWVEVPGIKRPRGTFRGGLLMPDSYLFLADYFRIEGGNLVAAATGSTLDGAWDDLLGELFFQIEIFTSQTDMSKGTTLELWAGNRNHPDGEWAYAVDRKIELA